MNKDYRQNIMEKINSLSNEEFVQLVKRAGLENITISRYELNKALK